MCVAVCCLPFAVRCALAVVCWLLFALRCLLFGV